MLNKDLNKRTKEYIEWEIKDFKAKENKNNR